MVQQACKEIAEPERGPPLPNRLSCIRAELYQFSCHENHRRVTYMFQIVQRELTAADMVEAGFVGSAITFAGRAVLGPLEKTA